VNVALGLWGLAGEQAALTMVQFSKLGCRDMAARTQITMAMWLLLVLGARAVQMY
jgi:hypothetical protein